MREWGSSGNTPLPTGTEHGSPTTRPQTSEQQQENEKQQLIHSESVPATIAIFSGNSYKDLAGILEKKADRYVIKAEKYTEMLQDLKATQAEDDQNHTLTRAERTKLDQKIIYLEQVGEKDKKNLIHEGMVEMGLDKKFEENKESNASVEEEIVDYIVNLVDFNSGETFDRLSDDPQKQQMFRDFRRSHGKNPTLKECKEAGVFIMKIQDTSNTKAQIDKLGLSDSDAYLLQKACNEIYTTYLGDAKAMGIHLEKEGNKIKFRSYGTELYIDLNNKTIENLTTKS
ncbi:MAG: hypothetical protein LBU27_04985 [Candidatus Peribacteria bacterium]|jgi:hypothetical protein|nr:hypothetical protein [Candidatus Peribacteria bacterium]